MGNLKVIIIGAGEIKQSILFDCKLILSQDQTVWLLLKASKRYVLFFFQLLVFELIPELTRTCSHTHALRDRQLIWRPRPVLTMRSSREKLDLEAGIGL